MINNYIKKCNKRIIFIIDNIDRAEKENITLIFKLVNNIFDFENINSSLSSILPSYKSFKVYIFVCLFCSLSCLQIKYILQVNTTIPMAKINIHVNILLN